MRNLYKKLVFLIVPILLLSFFIQSPFAYALQRVGDYFNPKTDEFYRTNNPEILTSNLLYTGSTLSVVRGVKNGNLTNGYILRNSNNSSDGYAFYQPSAVRTLAQQINGNPDYVASTFATSIRRTNGGGSTESWFWSRDIGKAAAATVELEGVSGQTDESGLPRVRVVFNATKYPEAKFSSHLGSTPTKAKVGQPVTIYMWGQQFDPYSDYLINFNLKINNSEVFSNNYPGVYTGGPTYQHTFTAPGTYTLKQTVTDRVQRATTVTHTIVVEGDGKPVEPPKEPGNPSNPACAYDINEGSNGGNIQRSMSDPYPSGSISSDSGQYNVVQGIPTSESLRTYAQSEEYTFNQNFFQRTGKVNYSITATKEFTLTWEEVTTSTDAEGNVTETRTPMSETVTESATVQVERPWSFWQISQYNVRELINSEISNYALPNERVVMAANTNVSASGSHSPVLEDHVFPADCEDIVLPSETIDGGTSRPSTPDITSEAKAQAESRIGSNRVKNDYAQFKGSTIMSDSITTVNGPTPSYIPMPGLVNMLETGLLISNSKANYYQSPSSGEVNYQEVFNINNYLGNLNRSFSVNSVTVHTPVVVYAKSTDDKSFDQRTNPPYRSEPTNSNTERHALILERNFTVDLPTYGQHRNIQGYGKKDYAKYTRNKQVFFPFDVYSADRSNFYPANTWIDVPVNQEKMSFYLPVWVQEGQYNALFRAFAINAPTSNFGTEQEANVTIPNSAFNISPAGTRSAAHVATDSIPVDVVGRLYDFRVTDISDYRWEEVFRTTRNSSTHTDNFYWVGDKDRDGLPRGNKHPFVLPIRQGSHPEGYKNVAIKTGYQFKFDFKSSGNMFGNKDGIRIKPTFYHVSTDGRTKQEVDLYYHSDTKKFIKVGSADDTETRSVILNDRLRNVPHAQLLNNAGYYYRHGNEFNMSTGSIFENTFTDKYINDFTKRKNVVGAYNWMALPWQTRTFIGPKSSEVPSGASVLPADAVARKQQWYGEYSIPADVKAVPKSFNLSEYGRTDTLQDSSPIFLDDGYIVVNFDIETIKNGNTSSPYLQYYRTGIPAANQWKREGFKYSFVDPYGYTFNLKDGDVAFYHADQSSYTDFSPSVTH